MKDRKIENRYYLILLVMLIVYVGVRFLTMSFSQLFDIPILWEVLSPAAEFILIAFLTIRFGDLAGQKAAQDYAEKEAFKRQIITIKSLLNEVTRIRNSADRNSQLKVLDYDYKPQAVVRMPVNQFETAFVSGDSCLIDAEKQTDVETILGAVSKYLTAAYAINTLIDMLLAGIVSHGTGVEQRVPAAKEIARMSGELPAILDELETALKDQLEKMLVKPS